VTLTLRNDGFRADQVTEKPLPTRVGKPRSKNMIDRLLCDVEFSAMNLSPQEAARALAEIEQTRATMRQAIRDHRGHYHLWIWGAAWIAMPLYAQFVGDAHARQLGLLCLPAGLLSALVGRAQSRQIRLPANTRFLGVIAALVCFALIFPLVLGAQPALRPLYAYTCLVVMQAYVVAGLWTDSYLLWTGIVISALILIGLFVFPAIFWIWMAVFGGGSLVATGFYVRHSWR